MLRPSHAVAERLGGPPVNYTWKVARVICR
jgi:hypothetical protein